MVIFFTGEKAFSEPESQAIRDALLYLDASLVAYFSIHSFGQYWLAPYGYKFDKPKYYEEMVIW